MKQRHIHGHSSSGSTQPPDCAAHFSRRSGLLFPGCEMCCALACAFDSPPAILRHAPACLPGAGPGFEAGSLLGCVPAGPKKGVDSSLEGHRLDLPSISLHRKTGQASRAFTTGQPACRTMPATPALTTTTLTTTTTPTTTLTTTPTRTTTTQGRR